MKGKQRNQPQQKLENKNMKTLHAAKLIHRSPLWRALILTVATIVAVAAVTAVPARATPVCGVFTETLAVGRYPSGLLDLMCKQAGEFGWSLKTKVRGDSDVYVTRHTFQPGQHTGWHTHPGPSLITVIAGELTVYEADSPNCTPVVYHTGESFTDIGCGDVHLVRNEGNVTAMDVAVQIVPAGALRRIDADQPASCPVITCP